MGGRALPSPGPRRRRGPRLDPEALGADLRDFLVLLEAALLDLAGGEGAPPGFDPRVFLAPGLPRVRPLLVVLSARAAVAASEAGQIGHAQTQQVAVAAELLHVAIRLHDAALGRRGGRRRRAARRLIGGAVGLLGGNYLTLRAMELVRHGPTPELLGDLLDALREIGEGHGTAQRVRERDASPAEVLALAESHTGAVFSFACRAGARLSGADRSAILALGRYGRHTGVAWHLAEDIAFLDVNAGEDPATIEERAMEGRPSFVVSLAAARDPAVGQLWRLLGHDPQPEQALDLAQRLRAAGAFAEGRARVAQESWAAQQALAILEPSAPRDALRAIAAGLARGGKAGDQGQL